MKLSHLEVAKFLLVTLLNCILFSAHAAPIKAPSAPVVNQPESLAPKAPSVPKMANAIEESQKSKDWYVMQAPLFGATIENQTIKQGQWLEGGKIIKNTTTGPVKLISKAGVLVILSAGSSVTLESGPTAGRGDSKTKNTVLEGMTRWVFKQTKVTTGQNQSPTLQQQNSAAVQTTNAVMGVRGTDFIVVFNSLLNETEIISFNGTVGIANKAAPESDNREIPKGHWGGLGGRFGQNIAPLIKLPSHIVEHFTKLVTFKTFDPLLKSNPSYYGEAVPEGF